MNSGAACSYNNGIMSLRGWLQPGYRLLLMFFAITSILVSALAWMGWRLVEQDRMLARQRVEDRCEHAADLAAAALKENLTSIKARLSQLSDSTSSELQERVDAFTMNFPEDSALLVYSKGSLEAFPAGRLLFFPNAPRAPAVSGGVFASSDRLEFQEHKYLEAAANLSSLVRSRDPAVRAEALARLGRCLWKAGRMKEALAAYRKLEGAGSLYVAGLPAELVARESRLLILEQQESKDAHGEASELRAALCAGRWRISRASFEFYMDETARILGSGTKLPSIGISAAAESILPQLLARGNESAAGRRIFWYRNQPLLLLWHGSGDRTIVLALGPSYVNSNWLEPLKPTLLPLQAEVTLSDIDGRLAAGSLTDGAPSSVRLTSATQLPWTLHAVSVNPAEAGLGARRLILTGLLTLLLLVIGGGYFIGRAAVREVAVAQLQSDFVASVSHELRTPVTAMRQLSELLATGRVAGAQDRDEYHRALARESERLHRLVEGLLTFGRMEAGTASLHFELLDPAQFLRVVVDEFHSEGSESGHHVDLQIEDGIPQVHADREALACVLWNLLDNAVKYSPECPTIGAEVAREDAHVAFRVRDRGVGIPAEEQKKIFEKFVRGSSAGSSGIRGVGVGLATAQLIVAAHHGNMRVESRPGEGSVFTVLLPACENIPHDQSSPEEVRHG
jgi:two-component system phosphate regulon sensor histidine kinase PhoR